VLEEEFARGHGVEWRTTVGWAWGYGIETVSIACKKTSPCEKLEISRKPM
jgi:hypothetical protein